METMDPLKVFVYKYKYHEKLKKKKIQGESRKNLNRSMENQEYLKKTTRQIKKITLFEKTRQTQKKK